MNVLVLKIKVGLSMLLFTKLSKMTKFTLKSHTGLITNLLGSDLGSLYIGVNNIFSITTLPLITVGYSFILISQLGWTSFVGIAVMTALLLISSRISKKNG